MTTLELPDALLKKVKVTAAQDGQTMTAFITAALESKLASDERRGKEKPWMRYAGIFSNRRAESRKFMNRVREECPICLTSSHCIQK